MACLTLVGPCMGNKYAIEIAFLCLQKLYGPDLKISGKLLKHLNMFCEYAADLLLPRIVMTRLIDEKVGF